MTKSNRTAGKYVLPQPLGWKDDKGEWLPVPRIARTVPFGYEIDPDNKKRLLPIVRELEALELARKYVRQYSLRKVAAWLTEATGRSLSHQGLKMRLKSERERQNKARVKRQWAERAKEAIEEAEELEREHLGARGLLTADGGATGEDANSQ